MSRRGRSAAGYLEHGMLSLDSRPDLTDTPGSGVSRPLARERLRLDGTPLLIDVRSTVEYEQKHVHGSRLLQWDPPKADRLLLVLCAGGYRSSIAASLLQRRKMDQISEVACGLAAWESARLPVLEGLES